MLISTVKEDLMQLNGKYSGFSTLNVMVAEATTAAVIGLLRSEKPLQELIQEQSHLYLHPHFLGVNGRTYKEIQNLLSELPSPLSQTARLLKSRLLEHKCGENLRRMLAQYKLVYHYELCWGVIAKFGSTLGGPQIPELRIG